jgi:hypothetical protein
MPQRKLFCRNAIAGRGARRGAIPLRRTRVLAHCIINIRDCRSATICYYRSAVW